MLSATGICTAKCGALHNYRLFGAPFPVTGVVYALVLLGLLYMANYRRAGLHRLVDLAVAGGLGAELWFVFVQKADRSWCLLCLSLGGCLALLAVLRMYRSYLWRNRCSSMTYGRWLAQRLLVAGGYATALTIGFTAALMGVGLGPHAQRLANASQGTPEAVAEAVWFGNPQARYEVYFVSDWYCRYCREVEPQIEAMLPTLGREMRYTWIDYPLHEESVALSPAPC